MPSAIAGARYLATVLRATPRLVVLSGAEPESGGYIGEKERWGIEAIRLICRSGSQSRRGSYSSQRLRSASSTKALTRVSSGRWPSLSRQSRDQA